MRRESVGEGRRGRNEKRESWAGMGGRNVQSEGGHLHKLWIGEMCVLLGWGGRETRRVKEGGKE